MSSNWTNVTVNSDILSEVDQISNYIYEYLYGDIVSKICYYIVLASLLTVGPLLSSTVVFYEHFGADSQKRTILNRIFSAIFINISLGSFIFSILRILRDIYGLLPAYLVTWAIYCVKEIRFSGVLFVTELTCFRFLYIVVWKRMKTINDEFWMRFVAISTYLIALHLVLPAYLSVEGIFEVGEIIQVMHYEGRT